MTSLQDTPYRLVPRALFLLDNATHASALYRAIWPAQHASAHGFIADCCTFETFEQFKPLIGRGRYNVVVTPGMSFTDVSGCQMIRDAIRGSNLAWVYEADDDVFSDDAIEHDLRLVRADERQIRVGRATRLRLIQECDLVCVSRKPLADVVSRYTDSHVCVVNNAIDVAAWNACLDGSARIFDPVTIGWSGARRDVDDLTVLASAWHELASEFEDVQFVVQGNMRENPLLEAVPVNRLRILPWVDIGQYPASLLNIDIGCCTLAPTPWNACKSPNKWMEMTLSGAACVVSPTVYGEYVVDGQDALVAANWSEWCDSIASLIEHPELRSAITEKARLHITEAFGVHTRWPDWVDAWSAAVASHAR